MAGILVVLTTVPDEATGATIGRQLVEEGLAACVNLVAGVRSFYVWEGAVQDDPEHLLIAKVVEERFDRYERRVLELHPYDVAEVVALPVERVSRAYLDWCLSAR